MHLIIHGFDIRNKNICIGIVETKDGGHATNKDFVGKHAKVILKAAGIELPEDADPRMAFFEAENDDLYVQIEQMQPIIPIVRCKDFDEAMERAVNAEHDCKHSASIWSKNIDHVTAFGKIINTTVFVQNGGTLSAFGIGGSGTNSPTIATPTGDVTFTEHNVTVARSLTARIPFPFPLTEAESELFDGSKLTDELSLTYTPFSEALAATYRAMKGIYL